MTRTPSFEDVIRAAMDARLMDVHVALPGRVETYYFADQAADIQPLLKRSFTTVDGDEISESLPIIPKVPIMFPRAGGYFISFPINPGDLVLLIFNERSIDVWASRAGEEVDPIDARMHSLSDAVAFPCFYPFPRKLQSAHATNMVLGQDVGGSQIHIKPTDEIHLGSENAAAYAARADRTDADLTAILNLLQTWTVAPNDGGQALQTAANSLTLSGSAADKVKID